MLDSEIELKLGKNIKYVKMFIPCAVPMEKIEKYLKNEEVQQVLQKGLQCIIKAAKIAIENSEINRNLDLINNGMDGLTALIQGKEYTFEHKGVIYSLGQAFDETEYWQDKVADGNVSGAYLNFEGESRGFLQSIYLNYENNCESLENGHGFQEWQRKMGFSKFEKQDFERSGESPLSERLSEKSAVLGFTYSMIMEIGTDPLTYISGEAIAANIFGKTGKAAKIGIKGASGELDTVLKQGDNVVNGMLDAEKAAKGGSKADNIIEGGSTSIITPEMESKILFGERTNGNKLIGGHSPVINNSNPNYAVEVISVNADGTKVVKFTTQFTDGNLAKIKTSTIFPESWSNENVLNSIKTVGDSPAIGVRDGSILHRGLVNGVEIDIIKIGDKVISGYPTGGKLTPGFTPIK